MNVWKTPTMLYIVVQSGSALVIQSTHVNVFVGHFGRKEGRKEGRKNQNQNPKEVVSFIFSVDFVGCFSS